MSSNSPAKHRTRCMGGAGVQIVVDGSQATPENDTISLFEEQVVVASHVREECQLPSKTIKPTPLSELKTLMREPHYRTRLHLIAWLSRDRYPLDETRWRLVLGLVVFHRTSGSAGTPESRPAISSSDLVGTGGRAGTVSRRDSRSLNILAWQHVHRAGR